MKQFFWTFIYVIKEFLLVEIFYLLSIILEFFFQDISTHNKRHKRVFSFNPRFSWNGKRDIKRNILNMFPYFMQTRSLTVCFNNTSWIFFLTIPIKACFVGIEAPLRSRSRRYRPIPLRDIVNNANKRKWINFRLVTNNFN